jgi:hypothetical protein
MQQIPAVRWISYKNFTTSLMKSGKNGTGSPGIDPSGYVSTTWRGNSTGSRRIRRKK